MVSTPAAEGHWAHQIHVSNPVPETDSSQNTRQLPRALHAAASASIMSRTAKAAIYRYIDNPNDSLRNIVGVLNRERNVMGMMPHPERLRTADGIFGRPRGLPIHARVAAAA